MRVAVTTAPDRADRVVAAFEAAGLEPVALPCIEILVAPQSDLDGFRAEAASADLVVVTSARAVSLTWPDGMDCLRVAAVGQVSAEAAREAGAEIVLVGSSGSQDLVASLDNTDRLTVAYPHALGANPAIREQLVEQSMTLIDIAAYEAVPIAPASDSIKAALFGSPSAVEGWASARTFERIVVASIGPVTSAALREQGVEDPIEPGAPSLAEVAARIRDIERTSS